MWINFDSYCDSALQSILIYYNWYTYICGNSAFAAADVTPGRLVTVTNSGDCDGYCCWRLAKHILADGPVLLEVYTQTDCRRGQKERFYCAWKERQSTGGR